MTSGFFGAPPLTLEANSTAFESALFSGGDERLSVREDGLNRYGCAPRPRNGFELGSCTSSSPSALGYASAYSAWEKLCAAGFDNISGTVEALMNGTRVALTHWLEAPASLAGVVLTPSGTDAELIGVHLARRDGGSVLNIVVAPDEVGSGTIHAAGCRHFAELTPSGTPSSIGAPIDSHLVAATESVGVHIRDREGRVRPEREVEEEILGHVHRAEADGARALVHAVAHSKTGLRLPSEAVLERIAGASRSVDFLVDAAQGRLHQKNIVRHLDAGRMVLFTGSKFFGGPTFSGALFVPKGIRTTGHPLPPGYADYFTPFEFPAEFSVERQSLAPRLNIGLALRWQAALAEMRRVGALSFDLHGEVLKAFASATRSIVQGRPYATLVEHDDNQDESEPPIESVCSVFNLELKRAGAALTKPELARIHTWLNRPAAELAPGGISDAEEETLNRVFHLGQPVVITPDNTSEPRAVLRLAIGAPLLVDIAGNAEIGLSFRGRVRWIESNLKALFAKIEFLLQHFDEMSKV